MDLRYEGVLSLCFRVAQKLLDPSHGGACTSDDQAIACLLLKNCATILKSSSQRQSLEVRTYCTYHKTQHRSLIALIFFAYILMHDNRRIVAFKWIHVADLKVNMLRDTLGHLGL